MKKTATSHTRHGTTLDPFYWDILALAFDREPDWSLDNNAIATCTRKAILAAMWPYLSQFGGFYACRRRYPDLSPAIYEESETVWRYLYQANREVYDQLNDDVEFEKFKEDKLKRKEVYRALYKRRIK